MRAIKVRAWSNEHHRYCDFVTLAELNADWEDYKERKE